MTKQEMKKERILQTAIDVFSRDGFHGAKITKIAELADVAAGSIYLYFANKEQILEEVLIRSWSKIENRLLELTGNNTISNTNKIMELTGFIAERVFENRNIATMILQEHQFWSSAENPRLNDIVKSSTLLLKDIIIAGMKAEEFRSTLIPSLAASYFIGGVWSLMEYWAENSADYNYEIIREQVSSFAINSLK